MRRTRYCALGDDFEGAHHVVGLVLENVAVVELLAGVAFEAGDEAGDAAAGALNSLFPAGFVRLWLLVV
jgi:hypothetical protein